MWADPDVLGWCFMVETRGPKEPPVFSVLEFIMSATTTGSGSGSSGGKSGTPAGGIAPAAGPLAAQPGRGSGGVGKMSYNPGDKFNLSPMEARERYGIVSESLPGVSSPIPADEAWVAPINNFSKKDVKAEKWVLINYKAGTITYANTFDGFAGSSFKQDVATFPLDMKKAKSKISDHTKMTIDECPIACTPDQAAEHKTTGLSEVMTRSREQVTA